MTRINCVPPSELHSKHLVAEYRELPRVFRSAHGAWKRGEEPDNKHNPSTYVLGTGHMRFFYGRLGYLKDRFDGLVAEMQKRGYKPTYTTCPQYVLPPAWFGWWEPTPEALALNRERLEARKPKS